MVAKPLDRLVRKRAGDRCEYCRLPQSAVRFRHALDHVIARQHRGPTTAENLALCCHRCNSYKGTNLTGIDPTGGDPTRLFNPRTDRWEEHFRWDGVVIVGRTPIGRTTVELLRINDDIRVALREQLVEQGLMETDA